MNLGKAIKFCRTQREMTQAQLAERTNVSVSYISLIEQNKRDPVFSTVEKIAEELAVPTSILLFLAADTGDLSPFDRELAEKLSFAALNFIRESKREPSLL
ncbi:MAG: helix-turn-helix transcriptional regulator [Gammaproteobacteria bacterium]|nr:helix-turn-helix transcriptional regulator [Gammaproteobacteria bacterium]